MTISSIENDRWLCIRRWKFRIQSNDNLSEQLSDRNSTKRFRATSVPTVHFLLGDPSKYFCARKFTPPGSSRMVRWGYSTSGLERSIDRVATVALAASNDPRVDSRGLNVATRAIVNSCRSPVSTSTSRFAIVLLEEIPCVSALASLQFTNSPRRNIERMQFSANIGHVDSRTRSFCSNFAFVWTMYLLSCVRNRRVEGMNELQRATEIFARGSLVPIPRFGTSLSIREASSFPLSRAGFDAESFSSNLSAQLEQNETRSSRAAEIIEHYRERTRNTFAIERRSIRYSSQQRRS